MIVVSPSSTVCHSELSPKEIRVSGYKHAAVQIIVASIAVNHPVILRNVPRIKDTVILSEIIDRCGGKAIWEGDNLYIDPINIRQVVIPEDLSKQIHGSLYLMPVFAGRMGKVVFYEAGGCQIGNRESEGKRPVNHMLEVMKCFGCVINNDMQPIMIHCNEYQSCTIDILDYSNAPNEPNGQKVSGATKTAILCALQCKRGETRILNPYYKPDVIELLEFGIRCGYNITYSKQEIVIGQNNLDNHSLLMYDLMSDISEIMTYIALAICREFPLTLTNVTVDKVKLGMMEELKLLYDMGVTIEWREQEMEIWPVDKLKPQHIVVTSHGIYSDHHPFFTLMLLKADGVSKIEEQVWCDRFEYVEDLRKLGAKIDRKGNVIEIFPSTLDRSGQTLVAKELRGAAVLLLAALQCPGANFIQHIDHLERGYYRLMENVSDMLGVKFI